MDFEKASAELSKPLDPKHVNPPKKYGPKGDYIEGWHAIAEANRIFGHFGWSYTSDLRQDDVRQALNSKGEDQFQAAYTCICTVTVGGVTRQDVGFGSGFAKQIGDAIEGAAKEAVTDALKRALRTFGHPFGLALYDKTRANVAAPEPTDEETRNRIKAALGKAKTRAQLVKLRNRDDFSTARDGLPVPMQHEVDAAFDAAWKRLPEDPTIDLPPMTERSVS